MNPLWIRYMTERGLDRSRWPHNDGGDCRGYTDWLRALRAEWCGVHRGGNLWGQTFEERAAFVAWVVAGHPSEACAALAAAPVQGVLL